GTAFEYKYIRKTSSGSSIEDGLRSQAGIHSIQVAERAVVEYDPIVWTDDKIVEEISDMGFDATLIPTAATSTLALRIFGMTCGSCVATIEKQVAALLGVLSVAVSLPTERAQIEYNRAMVSPREIVECVEDCGFDAVLADDNDATRMQSLTKTRKSKNGDDYSGRVLRLLFRCFSSAWWRCLFRF
ncbi:hypothetical protein FRC11_002431, partial [Ceratobasidium sp. 423]